MSATNPFLTEALPHTVGLRLENLSKDLSGRTILDSITMDISPGSRTAILGPSGCGKTTLLRIIAGLDRPTKGRIEFLPPPGATAQNASVGMIFQDLYLWPHLTISQSLHVALSSCPLKRDHKKKRILSLLHTLHLEQHADAYPRSLSGGEQQRAALARTLITEPSILLLDEPFAHLDWELRQELLAYIKSLPTTTIFVTHDQLDALEFEGDIALMNRGTIIAKGAPADLAPDHLDHPFHAFVRNMKKVMRELEQS
jgi:ABC-type Fe3+/spermidine/putrescine transport system ATPase subunit